jgi:hypothetical protein
MTSVYCFVLCCSFCRVFECALLVAEVLEGVEIRGMVVVVMVRVIGSELRLVSAILVPVFL